MNNHNPQFQTLAQNTLIDLVVIGLTSQTGSQSEISSPEQHILLRARSMIRGRLKDHDLDRNKVAEGIGMSVWRISEIFAKEDSSLSIVFRTELL